MTTLKIRNETRRPVRTYITLGATPGCVQDVSLLGLSDGLVINRLAALMGDFILPAHTDVLVLVPDDMGVNGNVTFDTPPLNCPCPEFPEGVNLAEFIINNGFQPDGQETVDISCVCGANAFIAFELSSQEWTANGGAIQVSHISNGTCYDNTGRAGVFPYGCDDCVSSDNPPACVGRHPEYANSEPICTVQRPASGNDGGTVCIVFHGYTPVPA